MSRKVPPKTMKDVNDYSLRLRNAMRTFRASDDPLWKRTKEGLDWFAGLSMDHLPSLLVDEIDGRFAAINSILESHSVDTFDDYPSLPPDALVEIQDLIEGFAFDKEPFRSDRKTASST